MAKIGWSAVARWDRSMPRSWLTPVTRFTPSRCGPITPRRWPRGGLRCEGASGDRTVPIHASTTTDGGPCDLVIIATKALDVEAAAHSCVPLLGPETIVQTIQNGLGSPEIAAPMLGADRIAVGVVGASIRAPGRAHHNGMEMIRFGAFAGLPKQLLQASAKIWESAGFKVALLDDIK
jgi:2-dehydropantoate 2-reductase